MRIAIVDTLYTGVLDDIYARSRALAQAPSAEQLAAILAVGFGTSDTYSTGLNSAGHDAVELVVNALPLQRRWAAEHGLRSLEAGLALTPHGPPGRELRRRLLRAVALAQIEWLDAELVYLQDLTFLTRAQLRRLKRDGRRLIGQIGSAPPRDGRVEELDLAITSFPHFVDRLEARGVPARYQPLAFDPRALERVGAAARDVDVAFVGTIHAPAIHRGGTALLERLANELDLQLWGQVDDRLDPRSPIHARHHGPVWGDDMFGVLARARIVVNRHGDIAEGFANNMRLFEATGMGALLLTEAAPNLGELFVPGHEVETYADADELVAKIRALLADEDRRAAIAAAGQRRTLADHTYARRMVELDQILRDRWPG
jgi:hypothetical protein